MPTTGTGNLRTAVVPSRSTISSSCQSSRDSSGWLMRPTSKLRLPATGAKKPEPEHVLEVPDDRDESRGP